MKHSITVNREVSVVKIALTGKMRSGKDTIATHLYLRHGFDRVAFGDALKRTVNEVFPWLIGESKPRALLQQYGQLMREIDPDVWVKHAEQAVNHVTDIRIQTGADRVGVVITDLRQPNEYDWARANGYTIIRVNAPDDVRIARAIEAGDEFTVHDLAHETERMIDSYAVDYEISNDGSIDDLRNQIESILSEINGE